MNNPAVCMEMRTARTVIENVSDTNKGLFYSYSDDVFRVAQIKMSKTELNERNKTKWPQSCEGLKP